VPFEDDLGRELVRTFATASGARAFARSLRAEEEARQYSEEASRGREQHPSSGTGPS
jgi:predicted DNA-binding WGR domain protein